MSGSYRKAYNRVLPHAPGVADPFHVIRLANQRLDQVRRRVPNKTLGHRGRKDDPLYRIRRLLTAASEKSATAVKPDCVDSSMPVTPRGGTHRLARKGNGTGHLRDRHSGPCSPIHPPTRRRPPGRILPTRDQQAGSHHHPLDPPDHQLAHLEGNQRTHRSPQQPNQTDQTSSLRVTQLRELPNTGPPLRRKTQLGPTRDRHSPLKRTHTEGALFDEPLYAGMPRSVRSRGEPPADESCRAPSGYTSAGTGASDGCRFFT